MFLIGDTVNYGATGVCKVVDIASKTFCDDKVDYYVLRPVYDSKSTLFVPIDNKVLTGKMRPVLSVGEIRGLVAGESDDKDLQILDERLRQDKYKQIVNSGDRIKLAQVVKILYLLQQEQISAGKKFRVADERILKEGEKLLYDEFALVLDIKQSQIIPFLFGELQVKELGEAV